MKNMKRDHGLVAVVTGAARGIGRGIALVLAETGATIYVTDMESRNRKTSQLAGTVEDTADQVAQRGGTGIPIPLDHTDDYAVEELFKAIKREHGGLDLLVANAFNGNAISFRSDPFWMLPLANWRNMIDNGLRNHVVAAWHAAPLLIERKGLLVLTGYKASTEGIAGNLFYDLAMNGISRLTHALNHDLSKHGVSAVAISPGFTRTEAIMAVMGERPPGSDSVEFPGRAVRALLEDSDVGRHGGKTIPVAELAREYGFSDSE